MFFVEAVAVMADLMPLTAECKVIKMLVVLFMVSCLAFADSPRDECRWMFHEWSALFFKVCPAGWILAANL